MTDKTVITEKDLPPFFKKKIEELNQTPDDRVFYGKEGMKQIYIDAYAVAKHCGNLVSLHFFAKKNSEKQYKLVPQLDDSNHSGESFSLVLAYAKKYLKSKNQDTIQKIKGLFKGKGNNDR